MSTSILWKSNSQHAASHQILCVTSCCVGRIPGVRQRFTTGGKVATFSSFCFLLGFKPQRHLRVRMRTTSEFALVLNDLDWYYFTSMWVRFHNPPWIWSLIDLMLSIIDSNWVCSPWGQTQWWIYNMPTPQYTRNFRMNFTRTLRNKKRISKQAKDGYNFNHFDILLVTIGFVSRF